jgi:hypothetical protein
VGTFLATAIDERLDALVLFRGEGACDLPPSRQDRLGVIVGPQIFLGSDDPEADAVAVQDDRRLLGNCQVPDKLALRVAWSPASGTANRWRNCPICSSTISAKKVGAS